MGTQLRIDHREILSTAKYSQNATYKTRNILNFFTLWIKSILDIKNKFNNIFEKRKGNFYHIMKIINDDE